MSPYQKPVSTHEFKQRILTSIDKLSDRATFNQASSDLNYLAKTLSLDFLPTFLSCILSIDSSSKSPVRVHCISLISLLSHTHKSSLSSHLTKIVAFLLRRLRDSDTNVRNACVSVVSSLSPQNFTSLLDPFLGSISIEQDLNAQIGCCLCLKSTIDSGVLEEKDEVDLRKRVLPKVLKLLKGDGFKAKGALLGVIESVIGVNDGVVININNTKNGGNMVGNVVGVAVEMLSSEDWMARKSAAELLLKMALVLDDESAVEVKRFVVNSLDSRRFDKVKVTREIMNRALEAWKEVSGGPDQEIALSRSNSSISKVESGICGASPPVPRRCSYGGFETPKPKKTMTKCRSSLSDSPVGITSPSMTMSPSTHDSIGLENPQRRKSLLKSRSSLSDDSTITDSSSVSKSSRDIGFEAPQSKKPVSKGRSSLPSKINDKKSIACHNPELQKSSDWKDVVADSPALSEKVVSKDEESEMRNNFAKKTFEERVQKSGSRVVPFVEEGESPGLDFGGRNEEVESSAESEELSLIRKQLLQIERQQSDLLTLIQRFMGNSQSGIDSLETRVSGLERALDEISHDLGVQSGRITNNNDSVGSTCCPSTEFLSPKFWRRTEGRSSISKSSYSGSMPNKDNNNIEAPQVDISKYHEQNEGIYRESWGSVKGVGQNVQRGRNCSPRSFDSASTATCITSVVRGA
ncbi:TORTIFOLIA1-like protein 4 [Bienertia sinuspersici]